MKITGLIVALLTAGALAVLGQEGTVEDIKHGAKKAGEKIKARPIAESDLRAPANGIRHRLWTKNRRTEF